MRASVDRLVNCICHSGSHSCYAVSIVAVVSSRDGVWDGDSTTSVAIESWLFAAQWRGQCSSRRRLSDGQDVDVDRMAMDDVGRTSTMDGQSRMTRVVCAYTTKVGRACQRQYMTISGRDWSLGDNRSPSCTRQSTDQTCHWSAGCREPKADKSLRCLAR